MLNILYHNQYVRDMKPPLYKKKTLKNCKITITQLNFDYGHKSNSCIFNIL